MCQIGCLEGSWARPLSQRGADLCTIEGWRLGTWGHPRGHMRHTSSLELFSVTEGKGLVCEGPCRLQTHMPRFLAGHLMAASTIRVQKWNSPTQR